MVGFVLLLFLFATKTYGENEDGDLPVENKDTAQSAVKTLDKIPFKAPSIPDDTILALYLTSPDDMKKMVLSTAEKEGTDSQLLKYEGKWSIEVPTSSALENDYSLVLKSKMKLHAIATDLEHGFSFDSDEFVVQYEVKFMDGQECGGAYIKLLSASDNLNLDKFHDKTPYTIMFGPDKCGSDLNLRFIFRHKNPKTGKIQEKHMNQPPSDLEYIYKDKKTHLFTLVTRSDNSFEIYVDQILKKSGYLLSDFTPSVNPPVEINDPNDKKPETWDERKRIPDPTATKPDDCDESAPRFVVNESATMPEDWLLDTPKLIPDPKVEQPPEWNSQLDGDWSAPLIDNPDCISAPGCGPWEKPKMLNPKWCEWSPPMIDNPSYNGTWEPRKIPNPDYFEDKNPYRMIPIRALGLELWSVTAEIAFDNFYIGTSKKGADEFAAATWVIKHKAEEETKFVGKSVVDAVVEVVQENPWYTAASVGGAVLILGLLLYYCCRSPAAKDDAYYKKTDEPLIQQESETANGKEADADNSGSDEDKDDAGEEEEGEEEEMDEVEEEKPKPTAIRQRNRKE